MGNLDENSFEQSYHEDLKDIRHYNKYAQQFSANFQINAKFLFFQQICNHTCWLDLNILANQNFSSHSHS